MVHIHLLGSNCNNLVNASRLERALQMINPDIITVDSSQEWIDFLSSHREGTKRRVEHLLREGNMPCTEKEIEMLIEDHWLGANYDIEVSSKYAKHHNKEVHLIGDPKNLEEAYGAIFRHAKAWYYELMDPLLQLSGTKITEEVQLGEEDEMVSRAELQDKIYRAIQPLYKNNLYRAAKVANLLEFDMAVSLLKPDFSSERLEYTFKRLAELALREKKSKILHLCNPIEIIDDPRRRTLFSRIKYPNILRSTLIDY
ncbi:hypothetical protein HYX18_01405 [Candidatus Woesearchaeota archaeon]|nr:hypothetical protein [Candidatus Woesearchaeota archaeon]